MTIATLDPEIARFIDSSIASVAKLDLLLHLAKEPSSRATMRELSRALAFAPAIVDLWVNDLAQKRLVEIAEDGVRYAPREVDTARMVERLAHAYRTRRVAVVARIVADRGLEEERSEQKRHPGEALSDAFKLRRGDKP